MNVALKILEDNAKSFKVQRSDGQVIHIAKTPETAPIYKLCKGGMPGYADGGGEVPGKAKVKGDSYKNDTVSAKLSPGEMVIPRSVVAGGPEAVAKFVKEALAGKHPPHVEKDKKVHADGGAYNPYQSSMEAELPQAPTPAQFAGTPSVAGEPSPALTTTDTGMTSPQTGGAPPPAPGTGPEQSFGVMKSDQNAAAAPQGETNVAGGGATPEPTGNGNGGKGGFDPYAPVTSQSETDSNSNRAVLAAQLDEYSKNVADYQNTSVLAGQREMALRAAAATAQANAMDESNKQMAATNVTRNKEVTARLDQIKQVTNKYLGMSIDSNRLYGDGQTGSKITAGIGLLLGAFGQGLSGQASPVPGIIERAIDRDINVQKANIEKAGHDVDMLSGGLKDYLGATNDMQDAMKAERARQLELVGKRLEAAAAANSNPIVQANAMKSAMEFRTKALQAAGDVEQSQHSKVVQTMLPHLEQQNPEQVSKVQDNIEVQSKAEHLMDMVKDGVFKPGVVKGRWEALKNKYGFSNASAEDFIQNTAQLTDAMVHDIGGSKGLQPTEFANLKNLGGDIKSNPEQYLQALKNIHDRAAQENAVIADTNAQNRRMPMNLKQMRADYESATPAGYAQRLGITPQHGAKKRGK